MAEPDATRGYVLYNMWQGFTSETSKTVKQMLFDWHDGLGKGFPGPETSVYTCSSWRTWVPSRRGGAAPPDGVTGETLLGKCGYPLGNPQLAAAIQARLARGKDDARRLGRRRLGRLPRFRRRPEEASGAGQDEPRRLAQHGVVFFRVALSREGRPWHRTPAEVLRLLRTYLGSRRGIRDERGGAATGRGRRSRQATARFRPHAQGLT